MLVEGAIADWSAIYLPYFVLTGPGLPLLDMRCSQALWLEVATGDYLTGSLDAATSYVRGSFAAAGLVFVLLFGNAGWALLGFTCAGAGLATIIPNTFAAAGNIEGSAPGPSLAVVTTAGLLAPCRSAPDRFVAQLSTFALRL